ncbi:sensor histidine kinase [Desulforamulus aeronauticus]|uniref:histidine kinase n=1 Tax=Desulforamulus aeronauticus DSM 10349 TaxID=1121421 RepID=A0A1M6NAV2_9FIRM|nr:HAMP domain-containing sensor histidine kinase [Desulforamulus aeronauticus]SHJ92814.1 Signal transduction histidine kinase [Desulforamulus aeronauticus DSM 10349]
MSNRQNISLRLKLLATFVFCLILSFIFFYFLDYMTRDIRAEHYTSYASSKSAVKDQAEWIEQKLPQINKNQQLSSLLDEASKRGDDLRIYLTDVSGKVLYHSTGATEDSLDIHRILYETKESLQTPAPGKHFSEVKPIIVNGNNVYLVVKGTLYAETGINYKFNYLFNSTVFVTIFSLLFYWFTRNKMQQIQAINNSVQEIANGNLQIRLPLCSQDELGTLSHNINIMAQQLQEKIAQERAVEKSKLDLITNISHDLRTPLTSIIGYLTLLTEKNYHYPKEVAHYISSSYNKAGQLKKLIDDLFEYTWLTSGEVKLAKQNIDLHQMMEQMIVEFEPIAEKNDVTIEYQLGEAPVPVLVDPDKLARTMDNLLVNALKFSVKPGTIKVTLRTEEQGVSLAVINKGLSMTKEQANQVFERFYNGANTLEQGVMPRSAGLGLSIAKNIIELHGGEIWLEHQNDDYRFCIKIPH